MSAITLIDLISLALVYVGIDMTCRFIVRVMAELQHRDDIYAGREPWHEPWHVLMPDPQDMA